MMSDHASTLSIALLSKIFLLYFLGHTRDTCGSFITGPFSNIANCRVRISWASGLVQRSKALIRSRKRRTRQWVNAPAFWYKNTLITNDEPKNDCDQTNIPCVFHCVWWDSHGKCFIISEKCCLLLDWSRGKRTGCLCCSNGFIELYKHYYCCATLDHKMSFTGVELIEIAETISVAVQFWKGALRWNWYYRTVLKSATPGAGDLSFSSTWWLGPIPRLARQILIEIYFTLRFWIVLGFSYGWKIRRGRITPSSRFCMPFENKLPITFLKLLWNARIFNLMCKEDMRLVFLLFRSKFQAPLQMSLSVPCWR